MRYVLAVLSHGEPTSPYAERTLDSFNARVTPTPVVTVFHHDGPGAAYIGVESPWLYESGPARHLGFCGATRALWQKALAAAADHAATHVFWLEHDFVFTRDVHIDAMADLLDRYVRLAQVQLMRDAVNATERKAGGLFESRRADYTLHRGRHRWLEHGAYFTTNPSLMRVAFMHEFPFGDDRRRLPYDIECEGKYGVMLVEHGWRFAVMGDGTPWVKHIGQRTGIGY